ncbi:ubiquitin carboxyl-terminal hydrolase 12A-like [Fundulus diaphanus]
MSGHFDNLNMFGSNKNTQAREYHGLRNQGSTCYLNSVLQVLFMTEDFREAVGSLSLNRCPTGCDDRIDRQLDNLFETLKERTGETNRVTRKLGIAKVNEQRDAAEYLEKILTLTSDEASMIFEGLLVNRTVCMGCGDESDEEKSFWNLPLPLRSSSVENYSVVEAIQEFFKDSHCTEDNQLYCETCQGKQDATIKCVINHHPEVLMLLLKRFEFNYYQMSYVKNARVVDVPRTVQIPKNQTYELYAFVEHFGTLNSGHYTATIKSQDEDRWYNFNDSSVSELNCHPFQGKMIKRSQSAYLLFYRKKGTKEPDNRKVSGKGGLLPNSNENKRDHLTYGIKGLIMELMLTNDNQTVASPVTRTMARSESKLKMRPKSLWMMKTEWEAKASLMFRVILEKMKTIFLNEEKRVRMLTRVVRQELAVGNPMKWLKETGRRLYKKLRRQAVINLSRKSRNKDRVMLNRPNTRRIVRRKVALQNKLILS